MAPVGAEPAGVSAASLAAGPPQDDPVGAWGATAAPIPGPGGAGVAARPGGGQWRPGTGQKRVGPPTPGGIVTATELFG